MSDLVERLEAAHQDSTQRCNGKAVEDVIEERRRQVAVEGWTEEHDKQHTDHSLAAVAVCYARHYCERSWVVEYMGMGIGRYKSERVPDDWPESWAEKHWKPKEPRRDLVRAAALLIAEIERIDRSDQ